MQYQCQYFTINSSISECDHKCETQNAEPVIGADGSSQNRQKPHVDRYGSGFGPPGVSGSGFWPGLESKRPVFAIQTRTAGGLLGPVANTTCKCISKLPRSLPQSASLSSLDFGLRVHIQTSLITASKCIYEFT
jgi:hypothetical protein